MELIRKSNKGLGFLLCVTDIYGKYARVIPLKDKKGITITIAFQNILTESKRKPNKIYKWTTSVSNIYLDKLDDIVKKYNNTYHSTIKMKPDDVKTNTYIGSSKKVNDKDPQSKLLEYQNIKIFLQKVTLQFG